MKLPFCLTFAGLTQSGKTREKSRINYTLNGYDKEIALLELEYDDSIMKKTKEYRLKYLTIEHKFDKINSYEYEYKTTEILNEDKDEIELKSALLKVDYDYKVITWLDYCKEYNDLRGEPWVALRSSEDTDASPDRMEIEVAYNKSFIRYCKELGLPGDKETEIVDQWLKWWMLSNIDEDMLDYGSDAVAPTPLKVESTDYIKRSKVDKKIVIQ